MDKSISSCLQDMQQEDLSNLGAILKMDNESPSAAEIESTIQWLYRSILRERLDAGANKAWKMVSSLINKKKKEEKAIKSINERYPPPSYTLLVKELAKELKVLEDEPLEVLEENISHAIIIEVLNKMSPAERRDFFHHLPVAAELVDKADIGDNNIRGPVSAMAILGAVKAGGFSVYLAATTALGGLTSAAGITLPFAAYTGLTSGIAVATGPLGMIVISAWGLWLITKPEWKKLIPAIVYIIAHRSRA